eukprot:scpid47362/ scgid6625/ 
MLSCVRHCSFEKAAFYFGPQPLPCGGVCPVCGTSFKTRPTGLQNAPLIVAPFVVPCPFVQPPNASPGLAANQYHIGVGKTKTSSCAANPMSLLLRPSMGDFVSSYKDGDILHIGIVDSTGHKVVHFDEDGIHQDNVCSPMLDTASAGSSSSVQDSKSPWLLAINISLHEHTGLTALTSIADLQWDTALDREARSPNWETSRFHFEANNCYDFVLACLTRVARTRGMSALEMAPLLDKQSFSQQCLLTVARRAGHYIDLYKKVSGSATGCIVMDQDGG